MTSTAIIAIGWLASGFVSAGFSYAHFQRAYPTLADRDRSQDTARALISILLGPCILLSTFICGLYRHGWLFPGRDPRA